MGSRAGNRPWLRQWPSLIVMKLETGVRLSLLQAHHRGTTMEHYAGIDVSLESASLCVVDATGRIVREAKVARRSPSNPPPCFSISNDSGGQPERKI
jgi:hypothetical protein